MISNLIIVNKNIAPEIINTINTITRGGVTIFYYNFSDGFADNSKGINTFVRAIKLFLLKQSETTTVKITNICILNGVQDSCGLFTKSYDDEFHFLEDPRLEDNVDELSSWDFLVELLKPLHSSTLTNSLDFIDINHILYPKTYNKVFDYLQKKNNSNASINWISKDVDEELLHERLSTSGNWIHTLCSTPFYSGNVKIMLDKYFRVTNSALEIMTTIPLPVKPFTRNENRNIDDSTTSLELCIVPLEHYTEKDHFDLMSDFISKKKDNVCLEFIRGNDTRETLFSRLENRLALYNKTNVQSVSACLWFNPFVEYPNMELSKNITFEIDETITSAISNANNLSPEEIRPVKEHFLVGLNEFLINYFDFHVFDTPRVKTVDFEVFNSSQEYNVKYNALCHFLHNDYFVSNLVNFKQTLVFDNIQIEKATSIDNVNDGSVFKNEHGGSAKELTNIDILHVNKQNSYINNQVHNLSSYLADDVEAYDFLSISFVKNIILYDTALSEHLNDVCASLLPSTIILTFDASNSFEELKSALKKMSEQVGVELTNVALFQDNDSRSKTYNFVCEETSIVKYPMIDDPSLNTWSKFQDFVLFLDGELKVKHFDLMMCKIYSNPNWNYVIDAVSSNLSSSLEIRSSENNTGHTLFEGDWILESPVVDVNMINLYFKESIKELDIQLGTNVNIGDYTKVGWIKTSHRFVHNNSGFWGPGSGPLFGIRCHTRQATPPEYSFTSQSPSQSAYTINFDNNTNVLISQIGWSNSYNYSDTESEPNFVQKTHSQSPGNLYIAFDDESNVDENTWFIPVTAIWNGMNHGSVNLTAFSHTNFWDSTDFAGHASLFGTFSPTNTDTFPSSTVYNSTAYFYVGPYTTYSGIPNPVPPPTPSEGMFTTKFYNYNTGEALVATEEQVIIGSTEPKLMDSNGDELPYNTYTENSIEYKSYVFTTVGTTSVSLSHDTPLDFMVLAGGGGGYSSGAGLYGGAGGGGVRRRRSRPGRAA